MNQLTISASKKQALEAYEKGNENDRILLENLFGKHNLLSILERCKTLEDACRETGKDINNLYESADVYKKAETNIETMAEALREGKPASECYYYPLFYRSSGGRVFVRRLRLRPRWLECRRSPSRGYA